MSESHHIVIVDDHPLFRGAMRAALDGLEATPSRIDEAGSLEDVLRLLNSLTDCDLILLDLNMPGVRGFSGLMVLRAQFPTIPVVIVSATEDASVVRRALSFGASGFIPKSLKGEEIRAAVRAVLEGETWAPVHLLTTTNDDPEILDITKKLANLTPQQLRVLTMMREGMLNKQIAYELNVSEATVKAHVSAILQKLGVDSRTQAVIIVAKLDALPGVNDQGKDSFY